MFSGLAPDSADRNPFCLAPLREVGKFGFDKTCTWGLRRTGRRDESILGVQLYIVFTDASAGSAAFHAVNVDTDLARQAAHMRSGGGWIAMLRAGNFAEFARAC